jgi:hypothetical protein
MNALARKIVLHELAHAWLDVHATADVRARFLAVRGLDAWNDVTEPWTRRGYEQAAEVFAWEIGERVLTPSIPNDDAVAMRRAFEVLVGDEPPAVGAERDRRREKNMTPQHEQLGPVCGVESRAVPSSPATAIRVPSGLNATSSAPGIDRGRGRLHRQLDPLERTLLTPVPNRRPSFGDADVRTPRGDREYELGHCGGAVRPVGLDYRRQP